MGYKSYALYTLQAYIIHPIFVKKCFKFHRLILLGPVVFQSNPGISFEKHGVVVDPIDSVSFFRSLSGTLRQKPSRNVRRRDPWRHQSMRRSHLVVFRTCSSWQLRVFRPSLWVWYSPQQFWAAFLGRAVQLLSQHAIGICPKSSKTKVWFDSAPTPVS